MIWYVILGALAAYGLLCLLWVLLGPSMMGKSRCTMLVLCQPEQEPQILYRLLWLRETGLLRCNLMLGGSGFTLGQRQTIQNKYADIVFLYPEE